jgi:iron complex outermembrane receptor protein
VAEELYSDGPHLASGIVQVGDPGLGAETAEHLDIGLRRSVRDLTWSVTAFATRYDDFIFLADSGVVSDDEGLPIFLFSQQDARFSGLEAEVFTPIAAPGAGEIDLRLFTDYVRGELTGGEPLPRLPPLRYGSRLQYHDERVLAGLEATRYAEQDETATHERPTSGYSLVSADVRWRLVAPGGTELELFAIASNLGDAEARKHTSFVKDLAPLPGRNVAFGVRSRF